MSGHRMTTGSVALALLVGLFAGCAQGGSAPVPPSEAGGSTSIAPTPRPTLGASTPVVPGATGETSSPPAPDRTPDAPPSAVLAAEGGDPVVAQLGTYTWGDAGSDSPWLPGTPIGVGAGEPLAVTFDPPMPPHRWRASLAAPDADGPAGAAPLAEGSGPAVLTAPAPGRYTLALVVTVEGLGTAHYAWLLDVR